MGCAILNISRINSYLVVSMERSVCPRCAFIVRNVTEWFNLCCNSFYEPIAEAFPATIGSFLSTGSAVPRTASARQPGMRHTKQ
jgi:hypothetical protein